MEKTTNETMKLIFYISFAIEALAMILLFSNNFIGMGDAISYVLIILLINAPILIVLSIFRLIKKDYILPIIGILISLISIALFISLLYALANFT